MRQANELITLHGRCLPLSPRQVHWLSTLLAQPGCLVANSEAAQLSSHQITTIRSTLRAHGLMIYRVRAQGDFSGGFILLEQDQDALA